MNRGLQRLKYILSDAIAASLAYTIVFIFRKTVIESRVFGSDVMVFFDQKFFLSLLSIVLFWLAIFTIAGQYRNIYRRSRLREFTHTFSLSLIGSVFLFFTIILDDFIENYTSYYLSFSILFFCSISAYRYRQIHSLHDHS